MNIDLIKSNITDILNFYPDEIRPLVLHQILTMISVIEEERESYSDIPEVKSVMDKIFSMITTGKFILGVKPNDNE